MFIFEPIIFLISYIFPKANKFILFGAWAGKSVSDNSKYLFEYFLDYESDSYECYFVTKNKSTISQVDADYRDNVLYAYSLKGIYYQLRAKTYVYSSGYSDFIRAMITRRNTKVNLWHGVPLKKIGFDDSHHQPKGLRKNLRNLRNIVFPYTSNRCDYIVSHNEGMSKVYESAFLPNKGVIISGQPRVDGLFKSQEGKKELFNEEYDYIVYTPTFRDSGENDFLSTEDLFLINKFCII